MKKKLIALTLSIALINITPITKTAHARALKENLSLGASLTTSQKAETKNLLGAPDTVSPIYIDGPTINHYLKDGSTSQTPVYSSALIEEREPGYGVQVQIITPDNIQMVLPVTYQNAAITAGARDVLIKVASTMPVTGEGALAGVYKIYEANGQALNKNAVQTAQKEIHTTQELKTLTNLTESEINGLQTVIKEKINQHFTNQSTITTEEFQNYVNQSVKDFENKHNVSLTENARQILTTFAQEYTKVAQENPQAIQAQIDSLKANQLTFAQAVDLYEAFFVNQVQNPMVTENSRENFNKDNFSHTLSVNDRTIIKNNQDGLYYCFVKSDSLVTVYVGENYDQDGFITPFETIKTYLFNLGDYRLVNFQTLIDVPEEAEIDEVVLSLDQARQYLLGALFEGVSGFQVIDEGIDRSQDGYDQWYLFIVRRESDNREYYFKVYSTRAKAGTIDMVEKDYIIERFGENVHIPDYYSVLDSRYDKILVSHPTNPLVSAERQNSFSRDNFELLNVFDNTFVFRNLSDGLYYTFDTQGSVVYLTISKGPFENIHSGGELPENPLGTYTLDLNSFDIIFFESDRLLSALTQTYGENPLIHEEAARQYLMDGLFEGRSEFIIKGSAYIGDGHRNGTGYVYLVERVSDGFEYGFIVNSAGPQIGLIGGLDLETARGIIEADQIRNELEQNENPEPEAEIETETEPEVEANVDVDSPPNESKKEAKPPHEEKASEEIIPAETVE